MPLKSRASALTSSNVTLRVPEDAAARAAAALSSRSRTMVSVSLRSPPRSTGSVLGGERIHEGDAIFSQRDSSSSPLYPSATSLGSASSNDMSLNLAESALTSSAVILRGPSAAAAAALSAAAPTLPSLSRRSVSVSLRSPPRSPGFVSGGCSTHGTEPSSEPPALRAPSMPHCSLLALSALVLARFTGSLDWGASWAMLTIPRL